MVSEFIETKPKDYTKNKHNARKVKIIDGAKKDQDMNKQTLKAAKKLHKNEIKKLRRDIRNHKLLMRQAKISYKLSK